MIRSLPVSHLGARIGICAVTILFLFVPAAFAFPSLGSPPGRVELERHLEREVMAYEKVDGKPFIVFAYGGKVRLDSIKLDPISVEWPPFPRWQWTGHWDSLDFTEDPASAGISRNLGFRMIFGQLNDDRIESVIVVFKGEAIATSMVEGPGYIIQVPHFAGVEVQFFDANGEIIWVVKPEPNYGLP